MDQKIIIDTYINGAWKDQVYSRAAARQIFLDLLEVFGPELGLQYPDQMQAQERIRLILE